MARYRHWENRGVPADTVFITSTVLDWVRAFDRPDIKDAVARHILAHCRRTKSNLSAFVVMSHHVHLLLRLSKDVDVSQFMASFKRRTTDIVRPMLTISKEREFDLQRGLNGNTFWKRSFRSVVVTNPKAFWVKVRYIHANPVLAGLAQRAEDYRWSSAWMFEGCLWNDETGLDLSVPWPG
ncbi:MAG: transposase [Fimbriimonadaceae bacterium]